MRIPLDPTTVECALQGYAAAAQSADVVKPPELAEALMIEGDRLKAEREAKAQGHSITRNQSPLTVDLWTIGVALVWGLIN